MTDEQLEENIDSVVSNTIERLHQISPDDRFALLLERLEWVVNEVDIDDVLMVPQMDERQ